MKFYKMKNEKVERLEELGLEFIEKPVIRTKNENYADAEVKFIYLTARIKTNYKGINSYETYQIVITAEKKHTNLMTDEKIPNPEWKLKEIEYNNGLEKTIQSLTDEMIELHLEEMRSYI